jgi:hypothetical protein
MSIIRRSGGSLAGPSVATILQARGRMKSLWFAAQNREQAT